MRCRRYQLAPAGSSPCTTGRSARPAGHRPAGCEAGPSPPAPRCPETAVSARCDWNRCDWNTGPPGARSPPSTRPRCVIRGGDFQLVLRGERLPMGLLGHLRIRALWPFAGDPSSIVGHWPAVEHGHGHLGKASPSRPQGDQDVVTECERHWLLSPWHTPDDQAPLTPAVRVARSTPR
jgi:hypothetical protein